MADYVVITAKTVKAWSTCTANNYGLADEIANYKKQGYVLVSNSFNNNKYQADNNNNVFYVHFIHGTKKVSRNDDVNMTVHYVMDDDSKAPSDNKQTASFTENGTQDLVTKKTTWTPADSAGYIL